MGVIRFPAKRWLGAAGRSRSDGPAGKAEAEPGPSASKLPGSFALLSAEIRRIPKAGSRIDGDIAGRVLNRCVVACLEILSREKVPVDLAGTVVRPVVEAAFSGHDGPARAARTALSIAHAVTTVQRVSEREFHVFGAIAAGSVSRSEAGAALTAGATEQVSARLREHAAAGEFLLSELAWRSCDRSAGVVGPPIEVTIPGGAPIAAYPLADPT
jgi:hypothetical protein